MKQHVLSFFPMKSLPMIGLILFLVLFVGVLIWVFRRNSDQFYKKMGQMPLDNEEIQKISGA
jgi:cytochrome c oxidase cbb3-type subunit IV